METDNHYFLEGLFIIGLSVAAALVFIWLSKSGHRDDVIYRIHFAESVSGLALGEPVKFRGVDVGTVKSMALDSADSRLVQVDVSLHKAAPVKTDTKASLRFKGITGVLFIELNGGGTQAKNLIDVTPEGQIPEIPSEKSTLANILEQLPKVIEKFSSLETKTQKVLSDVGEVTSTAKEAMGNVKDATAKIKENPSLLLRRPKEKDKATP